MWPPEYIKFTYVAHIIFLSFFNIFIYLFGCIRSQLRHTGSSFLIGDQTQAPCIGRAESQPLDHQGSPSKILFFSNSYYQEFPTHICDSYDIWISFWSTTQMTSIQLNNLLYSLKLLVSDFETSRTKLFIPGGTLKETGALLQNIHVQELIQITKGISEVWQKLFTKE